MNHCASQPTQINRLSVDLSALRPRFLAALGVALVCGAMAASAQDASWVVAADPQALATAAVPSAVRTKSAPKLSDTLVAHGFESEFGPIFLEVGIHPNSEAAERAFSRTMPQKMDYAIGEGDNWGFLSGHGSHLRYRNLVVIMRFENETLEITRIAALDGLRRAMREREGVALGAKVATPKVRLHSLYQDKRISLERRAGFVFDVVGEEEMLFDSNQVGSKRRLPAGGFEQWVERALFDREPVLRVARPTGEIAEIRLEKAKSNQVPIKIKAEVAPQKSPMRLDRATQQALIKKLESDDDEGEQAKAAHALAQLTDADLAPLFERVVADPERHSVVKKFCLAGLANALGAAGLESYRRWADDAGQPFIVRRNAIRLIGRHGDVSDLPKLRSLAEGDLAPSELEPASTQATRGIEGRILQDR